MKKQLCFHNHTGPIIRPVPKAVNQLDTPYADFWRSMCRKYLPNAHSNPRLTHNRLGDYIDRRYRMCCRFNVGQRVIITDEHFGKICGTIREIRSCWSFFELMMEITQGKYNGRIIKVGNHISEIKLAEPIPVSSDLFKNE